MEVHLQVSYTGYYIDFLEEVHLLDFVMKLSSKH